MAFETPDPGELRTRVTLMARSQAPTAGGGLAESYVTVATVRARLRALFGSRTVEGEQTTERATHVFTIRAREAARGWRYLEALGRRFRIHSVLDQGRRRQWQELLAEELGSAD
jgi:SPP1 family predicted phage head-tail adaptor